MNASILERLEYLNQSSYFFVNESTPLSSLINTPYRIYRSFYDAIVSQYTSSLSNPEKLPFNAETFMSSVGYFFSSYAVGCFFIALVLSRLSAMSSLRSNTVRASIPNWSRLSLHIFALSTILYGLCGVVVQYQPSLLPGRFKPKDIGTFLSEIYVIFTLSHCIETFLSITTNGKPLEESDYTIFELSAQFYVMTKGNASVREYGPDCIMALMGRLIIHMVEVFKRRRWRLACSTLLNLGFICYLTYEVQQNGLGSLSIFTKCKHFPKFFSVFIILTSLTCYALACIVRWNPTHAPGMSSIGDLQFHLFISNWFKNLNLTGEEEFSNTVMLLALLFCNPEQNKEHGLHRELPSVMPATSLHKSYIISGYMNKMSSIPETVAGTKSQPRANKRSLVQRFRWFACIISGLYKRTTKLLTNPPSKPEKIVTTRENLTNFNDFINENNYSTFMTTESNDKYKFLLPEEDNSQDYVSDECLSESDDDDDDYDSIADASDVEMDGPQTMLQEIIFPQTLKEVAISPRDISWYLSMLSILNCELSTNQRLTRSQYASINEHGIINEVIINRGLDSARRSASKFQDDDEDKIDMACVVCKTNQRNVVLWPCRCFSLCEECRVSLGLRGFKACVCCRANVHGYSKLNTV